MSRPRFSRVAEILRIRHDLECKGFPRIQMVLIVSLTGAAGFCTTALLLDLGWLIIWKHNFVAFVVAYIVFLALFWMWLRASRNSIDITDVMDASPSPDDCINAADTCADTGNHLGGAGSLDELLIPLMNLILFASLLVSSLWMVCSARPSRRLWPRLGDAALGARLRVAGRHSPRNALIFPVSTFQPTILAPEGKCTFLKGNLD